MTHEAQLQELAETIQVDASARTRVRGEILAFVHTDLICYRATGPDELRVREAAAWDPLLEWLREMLAIHLYTTEGVIALQQPEASVKSYEELCDTLPPWQLAGLFGAVHVTGSLAIGLAVLYGHLSAEDAVATAMVDETFQMHQWGEDPAKNAEREAVLKELQAIAKFLKSHRN